MSEREAYERAFGYSVARLADDAEVPRDLLGVPAWLMPDPNPFPQFRFLCADLLRLFVGLKANKLGTPGTYLACVIIYGPRAGHRRWVRRGAVERDRETDREGNE